MIFQALSIKQPWCWAILNGKPVENRDWGCPKQFMNRTILMHASSTFDWSGVEWLVQNKHLFRINVPVSKDGYNLGGIVGSFVITKCVKDYPTPFFFGEYGFVLENIKPLPFYQCRGSLKFFEVNYPDYLIN